VFSRATLVPIFAIPQAKMDGAATAIPFDDATA
jgi:hypothetical protein